MKAAARRVPRASGAQRERVGPHRARLRERSLAVPDLPRPADRTPPRRSPAGDFSHPTSARFSATCRSAATHVLRGAQARGDSRTFARYLRREGVLDDDPAALVGTPKREQRLPGAPRRSGDDAACSRCPTRRIRSAAATARSSSCSTPRGCVSASWSGSTSTDVNLSRADRSRAGQGTKGTARAVQPLDRGGDPGLVEGLGGPSRTRTGVGTGARESGFGTRVRGCGHEKRADPLFLNYQGGRLSTRSVDRLVRKYVAAVQHAVRDQPARAAALIRHPPAAARRRPARDPGAARARAPQHHAALHARERHAAARRVQEGAPESVTEKLELAVTNDQSLIIDNC